MGSAQLGSAYVKLDDVNDDYHHILFGYDTHPIQPSLCQPQVIGYGFGAPVAIFSSQPQLRYKFTGGRCEGKFGLMVAALSQAQLHASDGPQGTTSQYIRQAIVPNLYFQLDYERKHDGDDKTLVGAGVDYKRLIPRIVNATCNTPGLACITNGMADNGGAKCCVSSNAANGGDYSQAKLGCNAVCNPCATCFDGVCTSPSEDGSSCSTPSLPSLSTCGSEDGSTTQCTNSGCAKIKEHVDAVSATLFWFHKWDSITLRTQFLYTQNQADAYGLTGYAVTSEDANGVRKYAPTQAVSAWFDLASSKSDIVPGIFAGFTKTLGTNEQICKFDSCGQPICYGFMTNTDYEVRVSPRCVFNLADFAIGIEFEFTGVSYGSLDDHARVKNGKFVANYRTLLNLEYSFA